MEKNIENAQVTILLEIEGKIHLVGMAKTHLETIEFLIKQATDVIVPTNKSQNELNEYLGYNK